MGCTNNKVREYLQLRFPEERNIREWEEELNLSNVKFNDLITRLNSQSFLEKETIKARKFFKFLHENFPGNEKIVQLFKNPFFSHRYEERRKQRGLYDNEKSVMNANNNEDKIDCIKVKNLFFLLCDMNQTTNGPSCDSDKADYLFTVLNDLEMDDEKEVTRMVFQFDIIPYVTLSCKIIPEIYLSWKGGAFSGEEGYLNEICHDSYFESIASQIVNDVFGKEEKISHETMNRLFTTIPNFFTPGYFREVALDVRKKGK